MSFPIWSSAGPWLSAMAENHRTSWQSRAAELFAWAAAFTAWSVCLASEVMLAWRHGFKGGLGVLWAFGLDMTALSCMFLALDGAKRGRRTTGVWLIAGGATTCMVVANILVAGHDLIGAAMHGVAPCLAVALWHALVLGRRPVPSTASQSAELLDGGDGRRIRKPRRFPQQGSNPVAVRTKREEIVARLRDRADALGDRKTRVALIREVSRDTRATRDWVRKLAARVLAERQDALDEEVA